jgi:hypothetical protein
VRRQPQKAVLPRSVVVAVVAEAVVVPRVDPVQRMRQATHQATHRQQLAKSQPHVLLSPPGRAQPRVPMAMDPHDRSDVAAAVVVVARAVAVVQAQPVAMAKVARRSRVVRIRVRGLLKPLQQRKQRHQQQPSRLLQPSQSAVFWAGSLARTDRKQQRGGALRFASLLCSRPLSPVATHTKVSHRCLL